MTRRFIDGEPKYTGRLIISIKRGPWVVGVGHHEDVMDENPSGLLLHVEYKKAVQAVPMEIIGEMVRQAQEKIRGESPETPDEG